MSSSSPVQVPCESGKSNSNKKRYRSQENDDEIIVSPEQDENKEKRIKKRPNSEEEEEEDDDDDEQVHMKEKLQEERKSLRIYECREILLEYVGRNQVVIFAGETGCGKTTQIPQYLYEAGYGKKGRIGCTQPYGFAARSAAARVSQEMGVTLGHDVVGYSIPFEDCTSENTVVRYMSDETLLHQLYNEPDLISYSVLMVDDVHERTLATDVLVGLLKGILRFRTNLKLIISTATHDSARKFGLFFDSYTFIDISIWKHLDPRRVESVYYLNTVAPLDVAIRQTIDIHENEPSGDILVFLADREEIEVAGAELQRRVPHDQLSICPFYENMPPELEAKFYETTPQGVRKVVLATRIAETYWPTKARVNFVIDSGVCRVKKYDPRTEMESLEVTGISKASALVRANPILFGKCIQLSPKQDHYQYKDPHDSYTLPVKRSNLATVVLTLLHLGVTDLTHFDFLDPPEAEALSKALEVLFALGALENKSQLTEVGDLTVVGERMAQFPLDVMLSKAIVASDQYRCSAEVISIVAMLCASDHSSVFYRPENDQADADNARMRFHSGNVGDHIALLKVYNEWKNSAYSSQWCHENYIQERTMKRARDLRDQLEGLLKKVRIEFSSNPLGIEPIKKAITSGFFPHCVKLHHGSYRRVKQSPKTYHIHHSSGMAQVFPRWFLYHKLELDLGTDQYMRQVTEINPEWLLEVAPRYYQLEDITEQCSCRCIPN